MVGGKPKRESENFLLLIFFSFECSVDVKFVSWARSIVSLVVDARAPLSLLHNLNLLYVKSQALRNTFQQVMTRDVPPDYQPRDTTDHHQLPDPTPSQEVVKKENVRPLVSHPKGNRMIKSVTPYGYLLL